MEVESKLEALGLTLPEPPRVPPGITISFSWIRVRGTRAFLAGQHARIAVGMATLPLNLCVTIAAEVEIAP